MTLRSTRNITESNNVSEEAGEATPKLNKPQLEERQQESQENLEEYAMPDIIATIRALGFHALGKSQKETAS